MVCRTVQNLPLDHASMCRMAFEEAPPPPPVNKRSRGRPRTTSLSASSLREEEDEDENEQRFKLREQLGASSLLQLAAASTTDLSVLADVALKMDPDAGDSEETETSDEAEEQKMEEDLFSSGSLSLLVSPEGLIVLMEHNYCKPLVLTVPTGTKRTSSKQDSSVLLPADLNTISGVLEAPEEVIGDALPLRADTGEFVSSMGVLCESEDAGQTAALSSKKVRVGKGYEPEKDKSKKRRRKDKENLEVERTKKQKEQPGKKQRKRKLEVCVCSCKRLRMCVTGGENNSSSKSTFMFYSNFTWVFPPKYESLTQLAQNSRRQIYYSDNCVQCEFIHVIQKLHSSQK